MKNCTGWITWCMPTCKQGATDLAQKQGEYLKTIDAVSPQNFKVAYAFAAIPARLALENRDWQGAADPESSSGRLSVG